MNLSLLVSPKYLSITNISSIQRKKILHFYKDYIQKNSYLYPELDKKFYSIISTLEESIPEQKYIDEYTVKTRIIDGYANKNI